MDRETIELEIRAEIKQVVSAALRKEGEQRANVHRAVDAFLTELQVTPVKPAYVVRVTSTEEDERQGIFRAVLKVPRSWVSPEQLAELEGDKDA